MGARRRGSCARQRSRALDPFALTRGMHRFPQIASPLHIEPEIRIIAEHAGEATELFVLPRQDFLVHLEREPRVAIKINMLLCRRIRWQSERMEESALQPLPLARRLCALAADFGYEVRISQGQLGIFVGAARESVNRQLRLWRKDGILDLQRGRILLQNIGKLIAVARNE